MLPIPARPAIPGEPRRKPPAPAMSSSSSSSPTCCIASPSVVASASSTGRSATRWRSTQPFGADGRERGGEGGGETGLARPRGSAPRARAPRTARGRRADDRRLGLALERDPLGGLARDLPVDRSGRLQHPHHLAEVDLGEVERGRVESPPVAGTAEEEARKAGNRGSFVGLVGLSGLRRVGHTVSVWGCIPSPSPAPPASSGAISSPCSPSIPTSSGSLGLDVREPERRPANVEFHRVDIAGTELKPLLEGIDVVVHLAGVVDPVPDVGADGAGQRRGHPARARRRRVGGRPADRAHLERHRLRRVGQQPGPAHRGRAAAPEPALLARGAGRRGRAPARRVARRATPTSPSPRCDRRRSWARAPNACPPASCSAVRRCGCGARRCRCRWCTSTTSRPRSRSRPRATSPASTTSRPTAGSTPPTRAS